MWTAIEGADWDLRPVTASLGIATSTAGSLDVLGLVSQADQALYESKRRGRNRTTHFRDLGPRPEGGTPTLAMPLGRSGLGTDG